VLLAAEGARTSRDDTRGVKDETPGLCIGEMFISDLVGLMHRATIGP